MKNNNEWISGTSVHFVHPLACARDRLSASPSAPKMTNDRECGRSMVEMLGVLAVIGVLSVTGIAGFSMAMNKYKANQIIAAASTLYMMSAASQLTNPSGSSYGNIQPESAYSGVTVSVDNTDWKKMNVNGATPEVCKIVNTSFGTQDFTINCPESNPE